jgi:hypothetical protein
MRLYLFILLTLPGVCFTGQSETGIVLPLAETFVVEPVAVENISLWVPVAVKGPFINNSCLRKNYDCSFSLPAIVKHQKTENCPQQTAMILAQETSFYHSDYIPLTVFNGWQWECVPNISKYNSVNYSLPPRGGSWQCSWAAIMNLSCGCVKLQQIEISSPYNFTINNNLLLESTIEVKTFSSLRIRNGYPKKRQL